MTEGPRRCWRRLGSRTRRRRAARLDALRERDPRLAVLVEPMLGVTLAPTRISARREDQRHPVARRAEGRLPHAAGHGRGGRAARIREVLGGGDGYRLEFDEEVVGNGSPVDSPLMDAIRGWVGARCPRLPSCPTILPGFTDSRTFRDAFPDCVAYGFFPSAT